MYLLTFLCFASVLYLCVADPIAETGPSDQERMDKFMAAVEKSYDEDFAVLLQGLSVDNQAYMKTTTLDGVGSFMNYCLYRARQETDPDSDNLTEGDILVQFDTSDSFSSAVANKEPCQKDKQI